MSKKERNPLDPHHHPRNRQDFIDYDYTSELDEESKEFLAKFTDEYYGGAFSKSEKAVKAKKNEHIKLSNRAGHIEDVDKYDDTNLHKTEKLRKECYKRNSYSRNCIVNFAKLSRRLDAIDDNILDKLESNMIELTDVVLDLEAKNYNGKYDDIIAEIRSYLK